jgi:hypothetical protein
VYIGEFIFYGGKRIKKNTPPLSNLCEFGNVIEKVILKIVGGNFYDFIFLVRFL